MFFFLLNRLVPHWREDNSPAVRQKCGMLSGGVGIFLNLMLFCGKLLAGLMTASIAVVADAFNNLSDAASSVVTLVGFRMAGHKADRQHPYGHGRIEYITGLIVSMVILLVGFELLRSSVGKIISPEPVAFSWLSVGILLAAILVKLWMYTINRRLSRRFHSAALASTAADSLTDCLATGGVLLGSLIAHWSGWQLDGILGVLVALFILYTGFNSARDTLNPLLGERPSDELVEEIKQIVLSYPHILGIHDLMIHDYGPNQFLMSLHVEVSAQTDLLPLCDEIEEIEDTLNQRFHTEAAIHLDLVK